MNQIKINTKLFNTQSIKDKINPESRIEELSSIPVHPPSFRAGQRRLKKEMVVLPKSLMANNRPAHDLQTVYEKFNKRPQGDRSPSIEAYFACMGDIESMRILIKYGLNISQTYLVQWALMSAKCEMARFLADNGGTLPMGMWIRLATETVNDNRGWHYKNSSMEWILTLEYLLDRGTNVNSILQNHISPLQRAMQMSPYPAPAEQLHKDRIIKMLLDRGAKLNP